MENYILTKTVSRFASGNHKHSFSFFKKIKIKNKIYVFFKKKKLIFMIFLIEK
jgi:hypothetical protein